MRFRLASLLAVCAVAVAQAPEQTRVFTFANTDTPRGRQEVINALRMTGEISKIGADAERRTLTISGSADQLGLANWLIGEIDRRPGAPPGELTVRETSFGDPRNPVVKVFYLAHVAAPQPVQELLNAVRSISEVQRVSAISAFPAIIVRGDAAGTSLAEWLVREIDGAASGAPVNGFRKTTFDDSQVSPRFRTPEVRIYYPSRISAPHDLQEAVDAVRSIGEVMRVALLVPRASIVFRCTAEQAALSEWILAQLDQEPPAKGQDYTPPDAGNGLVRAAYLPKTTTQDLAQRISGIRESAGVQRVVMNTRLRGILLRGSPDQLARAESLLR
jgi:hypothetical protein